MRIVCRPEDVQVIATALRLAQKQYEDDLAIEGMPVAIAEQFRRQADDAHRIAACLEQRPVVGPNQEIWIMHPSNWVKHRRKGTCHVDAKTGWPCSQDNPNAVRLPNEFEDE